jgi:hypothetical protein
MLEDILPFLKNFSSLKKLKGIFLGKNSQGQKIMKALSFALCVVHPFHQC